MTNTTVQEIFNYCAARLRMRDWRLTTTKSDFKRITGYDPEAMRTKGSKGVWGAASLLHRVIWIDHRWSTPKLKGLPPERIRAPGFYPDGFELPGDLDESDDVQHVIYHELLHGKYPTRSEDFVDDTAWQLVEEGVPDKIARKKAPRFTRLQRYKKAKAQLDALKETQCHR